MMITSMSRITCTSRAKVCFYIALCLASLGSPAGAGDLYIDAGRGPVRIYVPSSYQSGVETPLVLLLHGYGGSGAAQENYMHFAPIAEEYGVLYAHPDGTVNPGGARFWNATDACCDFLHSGVDDVGYLSSLIDAIGMQLTVDDRRVYVAGHSNGGFMSYRMACERPEMVAAIASLAGATWKDPADCAPSSAVHVLQIHGTNDSVILYNGGALNGVPYPGAIESVEQWAGYAGCSLLPVTNLPPLDLDASIPGAESTIRRYADLCDPEGSGELWTIAGGSHSPNLSSTFARLVVEYLLAHPKPDPASTPETASAHPMLTVSPQPFAESCRIALRHTSFTAEILQTPLQVGIFDAGGRRLVTLPFTAGSHSLVWDGRAGSGAPAAAGVYFARLLGEMDLEPTLFIRVR